jgi:predicted dinucleotide-binding enzyme
VIVCADDQDAKKQVMELAETIKGMRGVDGGKLFNAKVVESITALIININRVYKAHASIKITGIDGH